MSYSEQNCVFPDVKMYGDIDSLTYTSDSIKIWYESKLSSLEAKIDELEKRNLQLLELVEGRNRLIESNMSQYTDLIKNINMSMPTINKNVIDMIMLLSKKFIKSILLKEAELNEDLIVLLLDKAINQIMSEGVIEVEVSEEAYQILIENQFSQTAKLKVNTHLSKTDFVIITTNRRYMHRLESRIDEIMSAYYG